MNSIRYVIFDFDGVVADTENMFALFDCHLINQILPKVDKSPTLKPENLRSLAGHKGEEKLLKVGQILDVNLSPYVDEFLKLRNERRQNLFNDYPVKLGQNIDKLIERLDKRYAIATNKTSKKLAFDITAMGIESLFPRIVTCDPPLNRKPAPDVILKAIEVLGAEPKECCYVGDNTIDMHAATSAGVAPVGFIIEGKEGHVDRINNLQKAGAQLIIDDFKELEGYIKL